jgi:hypothetical protein
MLFCDWVIHPSFRTETCTVASSRLPWRSRDTAVERCLIGGHCRHFSAWRCLFAMFRVAGSMMLAFTILCIHFYACWQVNEGLARRIPYGCHVFVYKRAVCVCVCACVCARRNPLVCHIMRLSSVYSLLLPGTRFMSTNFVRVHGISVSVCVFYNVCTTQCTRLRPPVFV